MYLLHEMEHLIFWMNYLHHKDSNIAFIFGLNKLCSKQSLSRSLWKKVHRLEKSSPTPLVALLTNIRYVSEGKRLFLTSLQQTCNEYLYLNINKCELAFLLQKPSSDSLVICFREACLVTMIHTPEPEHGALRHRAHALRH